MEDVNLMELILLVLVVGLLGLNILFFLKFKTLSKKEDETELSKIKEDIGGLKETFSQSFSNMSKEVAKDMTGTLSRVDEKVASFNKQDENIQDSQSNFRSERKSR